jgi:hypothetical protein
LKPPAKHPCGSCPYRRDVPSGVWSEDEYEKLREYDRETHEQPPSVFLCHQQDGRLCAGWVATHDMENCLGFRIACSIEAVEDPDAVIDYETSTPLFDSGEEAARHGMEAVQRPGPEARQVIERLNQKPGIRSDDG